MAAQGSRRSATTLFFMSVMLEFTLQNDQFSLGEALSGTPDMDIELERIVPVYGDNMPFLWVSGQDFERFEQHVTQHPYVKELIVIDRVEDNTLYRGKWDGEDKLIRGIVEAEATILEAHTENDHWRFQLRLRDHDVLSAFYNYCTDHDIAIHILRTFTLTERTRSVKDFGLSPEQREALIMGVKMGYFETPSEASLSDLADQLDITQQAVSNRIRRGVHQVLRETLIPSPEEYQSAPT